MINFLRQAWRGDARLWKVWWLLGLPLFAVLGGVAQTFFNETTNILPIFALLFYFVYIALYVGWCNMAWSCSKNVNTKVWGTIAKALIVLGLLRIALDTLKAFQG